MYTINLTPAVIDQVRNYNRKNDRTYDDFNLDCINGQKCTSKFLDEISNAVDRASSSCFNVGRDSFDTCRK